MRRDNQIDEKSGNQILSCVSTATIAKWGNSSGIRIPKNFLDQLGLYVGDNVELKICGKDLIIKRLEKKQYKNLKERVEDFYQCPLEEIKYEKTKEIDWGTPKGQERW